MLVSAFYYLNFRGFSMTNFKILKYPYSMIVPIEGYFLVDTGFYSRILI